MSSRKSRTGIVGLALVLISAIVALIVAQRMLGLGEDSDFQENAQIKHINCTKDPYMNWRISVYLENRGESEIIFTNVYVNNMEASEYNVYAPTSIVSTISTDMPKKLIVPGGDAVEFHVFVGGRCAFLSPGSLVDVKVKSSQGSQFVKSVVLP
ncbi:MAG: hypothetical protein PVH79_03550 [Candidatus Bathyarchaeota archaeon]|jgi:hypothetical protein